MAKSSSRPSNPDGTNTRPDEASAIKESQESRENRGYVRYVNTATERHINPEDLWGIGFSRDLDLQPMSWTAENNWCVARADIPDDVYARAIAPDNDFVLVESKD